VHGAKMTAGAMTERHRVIKIRWQKKTGKRKIKCGPTRQVLGGDFHILYLCICKVGKF